MKKLIYQLLIMVFSLIIFAFTISSCQKVTPASYMEQEKSNSAVPNVANRAMPNFNLEVILRGESKAFGLVKFRQDNDADKIVILDTWVHNLLPNHSYKLQRAVDRNLDGNCTGTWLTLGKGSVPQLIYTDENGTGREELWRNLSAFPSGTTFDIHFRVMDAISSAIVLTSDCYQFTVR